MDSRAVFRQVADAILADIGSGSYPRGTLLPPEPELARRYGVSRVTVNQAVRVLRSEGEVYVARGRGVIIRPLSLLRRSAWERYSVRPRVKSAFEEELESLGLVPGDESRVHRERCGERVAAELGIEPGSECVCRSRKLRAGDIPVQLSVSWIPADLGDLLLAEGDPGAGRFLERYREAGHEQVRFEESFRLRRGTAEELGFLNLDEGAPVGELTHTGYEAGGRAVECGVHVLSAWLWELRWRWDASTS